MKLPLAALAVMMMMMMGGTPHEGRVIWHTLVSYTCEPAGAMCKAPSKATVAAHQSRDVLAPTGDDGPINDLQANQIDAPRAALMCAVLHDTDDWKQDLIVCAGHEDGEEHISLSSRESIYVESIDAPLVFPVPPSETGGKH